MKTITIQNETVHIADDAYTVLTRYLDSVREHFATDPEVSKDIETAAFDLVLEYMKGRDAVEISMSDVNAAIGRLGTVETISSQAELTETPIPRKLYRDSQKGWIGGVAAGLAAYFDVPVWVPRLAFVLAFIFPIPSVLPYLVLWFVLPAAKTKADQLRMHGLPVSISSLSSPEDYTRRRVITIAKIIGTIFLLGVMAMGALFALALLLYVLYPNR